MNETRKTLLHPILQPSGWPPPKGYSNGVSTEGRMVFTGGMIGWDCNGVLATGFVEQTRQALQNIHAVLAEADAGPEHLTRLTWYVTDIEAYRADAQALGAAYRSVMGYCFPAMATVEVTRLVEPEALVEIEATAVVPQPR